MANSGQFKPGNKLGGGKRGRSGRKSKAEELGLAQLLDKCWTQAHREECITRLSAMARTGNLDAMKLLLAYAYGKPVERRELTGADGAPVKFIVGVDERDL